MIALIPVDSPNWKSDISGDTALDSLNGEACNGFSNCRSWNFWWLTSIELGRGFHDRSLQPTRGCQAHLFVTSCLKMRLSISSFKSPSWLNVKRGGEYHIHNILGKIMTGKSHWVLVLINFSSSLQRSPGEPTDAICHCPCLEKEQQAQRVIQSSMRYRIRGGYDPVINGINHNKPVLLNKLYDFTNHLLTKLLCDPWDDSRTGVHSHYICNRRRPGNLKISDGENIRLTGTNYQYAKFSIGRFD